MRKEYYFSIIVTVVPNIYKYIILYLKTTALFHEGASLILRPKTATIIYLHLHRVSQ